MNVKIEKNIFSSKVKIYVSGREKHFLRKMFRKSFIFENTLQSLNRM
jgi:hypothetical protein